MPVPPIRDGRAFSEDCFNLQVYAPAKGEGPFPVLVFIHGGAFMFGSNRDVQFQHPWGSKLTQLHDVVLVLVNYRLGCLGFCHVPGGEPNLGVLDAICALRFVQREIGAFRGDPSNVTVAGESAGAMIIGAMLHAEVARGLFVRCVMMSGALGNILSSADATQIVEDFVSKVPDYRTAPVTRILEAQASMVGNAPGRWGTVTFQPHFGGVIGNELCHSDLDILIGVCDMEMALFVPQAPIVPSAPRFVLRAQLLRMGADASGAKELAKLLPDETPGYAKITTVMSALFQDAPLVLACEKLQAAGNRVCPYRNLLGEAHVGELVYIFGTWDRTPLTRWLAGLPNPLWVTETHRQRAQAQENNWMGLISCFARVGCVGLPAPEGDRVAAPSALHVGPEGICVGPYASAFAKAVAEVIRGAKRSFGVQMAGEPVDDRRHLGALEATRALTPRFLRPVASL